MTSSPFQTAARVLCVATLVVAGLSGLVLLSPARMGPNSNGGAEVVVQEPSQTNHVVTDKPASQPLARVDDPDAKPAAESLPTSRPTAGQVESGLLNAASHQQAEAVPGAEDSVAAVKARSVSPGIEIERTQSTFELAASRVLESRLWSLQQQIDQLAALTQDESDESSVADQSASKPRDEQPSAESATREAESKTSESNKPAKPENVMKAELREGTTDRYSIQLQNADVRESLMLLGQVTKLNVVVAPGVRGQVSAVWLQDVSADDALAAITKSLGLVTERDGQLAFVSTADELRPRGQGDHQKVLKVYRPQHIPVKQLQTLVTPLLSQPVYLMTLRNQSPASGATSSETESDGLLIVDDPKVIARVDELMGQVDQPTVQVNRPDDKSSKSSASASTKRPAVEAKSPAKPNAVRRISGTAPQRLRPPASATELPFTNDSVR